MTARPLDGKTALVTGGSRGVGAAIVARLADAGASVTFTYSSSSDEHARRVVDGVTAEGGTARPVRADNREDEEVAAAVALSAEQSGRLDILVNNAGAGFNAPLVDLTIAEIDTMLAINVRSVIVTIRESLRFMRDGGRIVTIGSVNADHTPFPGQSVYALTKGAVASLTRGLAHELAPRGITINTVQPGPIDTDANPADGPFAASLLGRMAADRYGTTDEVAALVTYLAGPDAAFMTSSSLNIDGGFTA